MLTSLSIRDVVIVDKLDIDFSTGLCALTGETGAGKSIVLDSLGLALGGRADTAMIRPGADKLGVTASFLLPLRHPARGFLAEHEIAVDEEEIVLRRVVGNDGRSRGFINDQPTSIGLLRSLGELLVEVHGQFETHGLLDPKTHIAALDSYRIAKGGSATDQACAAAWDQWSAARDALAAARDIVASSLAEEGLLRHQVDELMVLAPKPGEENALAQARLLMRNSEQVLKALTDARHGIMEETDVEAAMRGAVTKISRAAGNAGGRLDALCQALERAAIEVGEAGRELDRVLSGLEADPQALEHAEERLFALKAAARKHNTTVDELPALLDRLKARLSAIDNGAEQITQLAAAEKAARMAYERASATLSEARRAAAKMLDKAMARELPPLKLERAVFRSSVAAKPESAWNRAGTDQVVFEIATNPGMPPGPLDKIASGGELARFMLALKVVLADLQDRSVLIFDEVDAGISGATASAVGERLAKLARNVQVLVVTHSPQVAAQANHHWRVTKTMRAGLPTTKVERLGAGTRREEIARMLAGERITDEARAAADSLMSGAPS